MASAQLKTYTEEDYYSLSEDVRAELIDGQFYYMAAPSRIHQEVLNFMNTEINLYIRSKKGNCKVYPAPFAVKLFANDDKFIVEPDISVICDPNKLTDRGCTGAPDWIIEIISPSTASYDYIRKLNLYADAGVREYWIVDPVQKSVYVYFLEQDSFKVVSYTFQDRFRVVSYTFQDSINVNIYEDLWIDFKEFEE